ncbi:glycosyltransferase family 2 protein [Coralloluteibacterium thermophilus]|uniref:Glycosyltransferase family 2 protein n=1 Tax=Coralloluteibacterium thermophilum TaxID=2707049 RepID=A0ABV9NG91_9GAMM
MSQPAASIVLSTYNNPAWLARSLWGFAAQDRHDFEVVVADDGSGEETRALLERMRGELPFPLVHVWHEDRGFRKCTILNRGIEAARADYLIFTDGDCVPRADFVSQHLRLREPGRYLGGGYCKLPMDVSLKIDRAVIAQGLHTELDWLIAQGLPRKKRSLKLWARPGWRERLLNALTPTPPRWAGNNASGWKADLLRVNGFDERMTYGGEDLELGERLANAGVRGKQVRFSAVCIHLDHARGYVKPEMRAANERIRAETRRERRTWTDYGLRRDPP